MGFRILSSKLEFRLCGRVNIAYFEIDMLGKRYKSVNFGAERHPGSPHQWAEIAYDSGRRQGGAHALSFRVKGVGYRGTSLMRKRPTLGPFSSPMLRALWDF